MNKKQLLALTLIFFPLYVFAGAGTITLTLEEAVARALEQSLHLQRSAIDLAQTEYSASRLWSEIFPSFSLNAGLTFFSGTNLVTSPPFNRGDPTYTFSLGASLSLNPSISSSMRRIELAYRSQLLSYENARKQLEIQVIKRYLGLANMQAGISHLEETLKVAVHRLNNDRIARASGLLNELAWLNSQLSVETARFNLSTAQAAYQNALGEFLSILGLEGVTDIEFLETIEVVRVHYDPEQLILEHLPRRPDIISQRQNIERLELTRNITTSNLRSPTLNLSANWGAAGNRNFNDPFADRVSGSVTLNIPVDSWIPGTRQNQSLRAAGAEVEKALLDLQNTKIQAKTQIRSLITNLENTWRSLEIAKLRVDIAERTVEATEIGFRNGTAGFQELEDRRNDLSDARQRLLQGELSYQTMFLDLAAALNVDWRTLIRGLQ